MERGNRKSRIGVVVSNKMTKTVVVRVEACLAVLESARLGAEVKLRCQIAPP